MEKNWKKNSGIWNFFLLGGNLQNFHQIYALLSTVSSVLVRRPCWQIRKNKKMHFWKNLYLWAENKASTQGYDKNDTDNVKKRAFRRNPSEGIFSILNRKTRKNNQNFVEFTEKKAQEFKERVLISNPWWPFTTP